MSNCLIGCEKWALKNISECVCAFTWTPQQILIITSDTFCSHPHAFKKVHSLLYLCKNGNGYDKDFEIEIDTNLLFINKGMYQSRDYTFTP